MILTSLNKVYVCYNSMHSFLPLLKFELLFSSLFARVDKKRDKLERKVLDSQERAFWDVNRPAVSSQ